MGTAGTLTVCADKSLPATRHFTHPVEHFVDLHYKLPTVVCQDTTLFRQQQASASGSPCQQGPCGAFVKLRLLAALNPEPQCLLCCAAIMQEERETLREQLCAVPAEADPTDIAINVAKVGGTCVGTRHAAAAAGSHCGSCDCIAFTLLRVACAAKLPTSAQQTGCGGMCLAGQRLR